MKKINDEWVDNNSNRWNARIYGKIEAEVASSTLHNCKNCLNCYNCINCFNCVFCIDAINLKNKTNYVKY